MKLNYFIGSRRDGDIGEIYSDNQKVISELKWQAKISTESAMIDAWNWESNKIK